MLRKRLGLERSEKAELLREVASLAAWVVRQAEQGRDIQARDGRTGRAARPSRARARVRARPGRSERPWR